VHKNCCHKKPEVENSATGTVTALFMAVRVIVLTMRQRKADMFVSDESNTGEWLIIGEFLNARWRFNRPLLQFPVITLS